MVGFGIGRPTQIGIRHAVDDNSESAVPNSRRLFAVV